MRDGQASIPIIDSATILEDGPSLQQVTVRLCDPIEGQDIHVEVAALPSSIDLQIQPEVCWPWYCHIQLSQ